MADGKTHEIHGLIASSLIAFIVLVVRLSLYEGALELGLWAVPLGVLVGSVWVSPDLDMWNTRPMKWWGPLKFFWAPYAWVCEHRSKLSHGWVLGPFSRLVYMAVPVGAIWYYGWEFSGIGLWLVFLVVGIVIGNWIHLVGDLRV